MPVMSTRLTPTSHVLAWKSLGPRTREDSRFTLICVQGAVDLELRGVAGHDVPRLHAGPPGSTAVGDPHRGHMARGEGIVPLHRKTTVDHPVVTQSGSRDLEAAFSFERDLVSVSGRM